MIFRNEAVKKKTTFISACCFHIPPDTRDSLHHRSPQGTPLYKNVHFPDNDVGCIDKNVGHHPNPCVDKEAVMTDHFQRFASNSSDALAMIAADGGIVFANQRFVELCMPRTGYWQQSQCGPTAVIPGLQKRHYRC